MREIDAEYYGYLDDDDNLLLAQELKCEKEARKLKIEEFKQKLKDLDMDTGNEIELNPIEDSESSEDEVSMYTLYEREKKKKNRKARMNVPSMKEVEDAILEQKKKELLSKYVSDQLLESENEVKALAAIK